MQTHYKNIEQALLAERPTDKVVKILSNKFAIVQTMFTDGKFDAPSLCGLNKKTIYFYGHEDIKGGFGFVKQYAKKVVDEMPNAQNVSISYTHLPYYVVTKRSNKRYKKAYRKILKLDF